MVRPLTYHDREIRPGVDRDRKTIKAEWWKTVAGAIALTVLDLLLTMIYLVVSTQFNFGTSPAMSYAEVCGTISTALELGFFLPQMHTTCKLRDGGSLSLLMLEIQAPADLANSLYMWLGTGDHWTTWLTVLVNSGEEFTLLGTCLVFRCLAANQRNKEKALARGERKLHASLESDSWQFGALASEAPAPM